jgi:hypothetical protein
MFSRAQLLTAEYAMFSGQPSGGAPLFDAADTDQLFRSLIEHPRHRGRFSLTRRLKVQRFIGRNRFVVPDRVRNAQPGRGVVVVDARRYRAGGVVADRN